jgi:hypothetical protein
MCYYEESERDYRFPAVPMNPDTSGHVQTGNEFAVAAQCPTIRFK